MAMMIAPARFICKYPHGYPSDLERCANPECHCQTILSLALLRHTSQSQAKQSAETKRGTQKPDCD